MKRKAAQIALGLLVTKSPVSTWTKKSTTDQIFKKNKQTTRKKVQNTIDKQKKPSKMIAQWSVKKRVIENRKTSKNSSHGSSSERSSSKVAESASEKEEKKTDDEEEEQQSKKRLRKDNDWSISTQNDFSRVQLRNQRHGTLPAVCSQPKLATWLPQQRRFLRDRGTQLLQNTINNKGQETRGGRGRDGRGEKAGGENGVGGKGKEGSRNGERREGGREKPGSVNRARELGEEKAEDALQLGRELRRRTCHGRVENGALKRKLVVEVCRSENQVRWLNFNDRRISKASDRKKPKRDSNDRNLRRDRRSEIKEREEVGRLSWENQLLNDDRSMEENQHKEEEEKKEEEGKEDEEEEKKEKSVKRDTRFAVVRGVSVALTDVSHKKKSKAEEQKQLEEREKDKGNRSGSCGRFDPPGVRQSENDSTEVNFPAKDINTDEMEVVIDSDGDDDKRCKDAEGDVDDDVICISSSTQNPSSVEKFHMNGLRVWSRWYRSEPPPQSSTSADESSIQVLKDSVKATTVSMSQMPAVDILGIISKLQESFAKMKNDYEKKLREKDEFIRRLKDEPNLQLLRLRNELEWKTQVIEELNQVAERNVEIEAKISHLLSDRKAYEEELQRLAQMKATQLEDGEFVVVENQVTSSEDEEEEEVEREQRKWKKKMNCGEEEEEENEANDIEELLIGLKETPEDISFALSSAPRLSATSRDSVVPEPRHPLQDVRDTAGDEAFSWQKGRHEIRRLVMKLSEETKAAAILEAERRERVKKKRLKHLVVVETDEVTGQQVCRRLVLAFHDDERKVPRVEVNAQLLRHLKPHQVEGVEFMWDSVVESLDRLKDGGSGCILAHCMGLGKTLTVISLLETLLASDIGFRRCLIVSPLNAVLNWVSEWEKWVTPEIRPPVFDLASRASNQSRADLLSQWSRDGGILIIGYSLFRILVSYRGRSRRLKSIFNESLIDPGPDLVVCDEGHILKNDSSAISKCLNSISTKRRIVLTGTPVQNNLIEYHCMVNFVRPNLLGTRAEFMNRFVNPITNGQHLDSTSADVQLMKRRVHVLHQMLSGCIHRRDYSALVKFLLPKHEFVIAVRLSQRQIVLYEKYLGLCHGSEVKKVTGAAFFSDYQNLMRIWTHPWLLRMDQIRQQNKPLSLSDDDELESLIYTSSSEEEEEEMEEMDRKQEQEGEEKEDMEQGTEVVKEGGEEEAIWKKHKGRLVKKEAEHGWQVKMEEIRHVAKKEEEETSDKEKKDAAIPNRCEGERENRWSGGEDDGDDSDETEESTIDPVKECLVDGDGKARKGKEHKARVIAGEVIRNWQTRTRRKDPVEGEEEEMVCAEEKEVWWSSFLTEDDHLKIELSGKIVLLFEILRLAENIGDKVLVFSQSLLALDLIEDFLKLKTDEATQQSSTTQSGCVDGTAAMSRSVWIKDEDYLRMDGSTGASTRKRLTTNFNDLNNTRLRLFLISTKAGGLGINLESANRVVIFDASWNPSHDIQSIFRVYRFGQTKPVFIYRFLGQGTMEEKIYDRQVTKETLSHRVVDEQQIDRHFTAADLGQLYTFSPDQMNENGSNKRPTLPLPKDVILAELLSQEEESHRWIVEYHDHDSLLERRPDEDLTDDERKAAWDEYERERQTTTVYRHDVPLVHQPPAGALPGPVIDICPSISKTSMKTSVSGHVPQQQPTAFVSQTSSSSSSSTSSDMTATHIPNLSDDLVDLVTSHLPLHLKMKFNFQMSHLPRVIQEILRYNPDITIENLQQRIDAFVGIHTA